MSNMFKRRISWYIIKQRIRTKNRKKCGCDVIGTAIPLLHLELDNFVPIIQFRCEFLNQPEALSIGKIRTVSLQQTVHYVDVNVKYSR